MKYAQEEAAKLLQVCWLEVTGSTKNPLSKGKKYGISFTIELMDGAFGWHGCPVFMMAKIGKKGKYRWQKSDLSSLPKNQKLEIPLKTSENKYPFTIDVNPSEDDPVLYFGLYEVWTGKWKGGLNIYQAKIEEISST
ncbi:conserved hypothetical protein [Ricinus communis]|uniref:Protein PHLOEM PROTEIN 2-LIKE A9-like n=1 Tax=Ricinus communis TaxID=3988 RepID=B9SDQ3_RICCO|nr:conserved hypothetical protein [Ricinus communis]